MMVHHASGIYLICDPSNAVVMLAGQGPHKNVLFSWVPSAANCSYPRGCDQLHVEIQYIVTGESQQYAELSSHEAS